MVSSGGSARAVPLTNQASVRANKGRILHLLWESAERNSSAAAAALRAMMSRRTRIAAAVCWSGLFGVRLYPHKLPLPHFRCNARILCLHPITDDQLPDFCTPRRVPKVLD